MADDMTEREERIRTRARSMWERDGRPQGQDDYYWFKAEAEIDAEDAALDRTVPPRSPP